MPDIIHFEVEGGRKACTSKPVSELFLTLDRSKVTCRSCKRALSFRESPDSRYQITITLSKATPAATEWLEAQTNRSYAMVEALNFYVASLE